MATQYKAVVFDLDDTLIDTRGCLVPEALARVARAAGVPRERLDAAGKSIDEVLRPAGPLSEAVRAAAAAAWYSPDVPRLAPVPGALDLLQCLAGITRLFLLTRGDPVRQQRKIDRAGLRDRFEAVIVRPIEATGTKRDDLLAILDRCRIQPHECLVVGDDEHDEIFHARALGCDAVRVPATTWNEVLELVSERST